MRLSPCIERVRLYRRNVSFLVLSVFILNTIFPIPGYAQELFSLPSPGTMVAATNSFTPLLIEGITIYPDNPLRFGFIVDTGESKLAGKELNAEATKLIKYFLASLTVPEKDLWVNLSPYEKIASFPMDLE